jgi:RNA polymerase sigma factor (sigma-70 family)
MKTSLPAVVQQIVRLAQPPLGDDLTDRQLLQRFAGAHDEAAFVALVRRHGKMVLGVCRRLLRNEQDAEDAFQATFLVLARRAASVCWHESAGGWLHTVARRLAATARAQVARRCAHERSTARLPEVPAPEANAQELGALLDEEMAHLHERYRSPLLLCYVEDATRDQAAHQLGLSLRTLDRRLHRGREALRARLARVGVTFSAALLAATLAERATASVEPALTAATVRAAVQFSAGEPTTVTATARALADGLLRNPLRSKLIVAGLVLLTITAAGIGLVFPAQSPAPPPEVNRASEKEPAVDAQGDPLPPGALARLGTVRWHHGGSLSHLGFSAGGKEIVTAGPDGIVRVRDVATGKELRRFGHGSDFLRRAAALTPDGAFIAVAEADGTVCVWDVATGKETLRVATGHKEGVCAVALSPDGKRLASRGLDRNVIVWSVASGKELNRLSDIETAGPPGQPAGAGESMTFSPDGTVLAISFADLSHREAVGLRLWELRSGKDLVRIAERHLASGEAPWEKPAAFSPDGKIVARVVRGAVALFDVSSGKELRTVALEMKDSIPEQVAFSADGKQFAIFTNRETVSVHDVATGKPIRTLDSGATGFSYSRRDMAGRRLAFSPDGKLLVQVWGGNSLRLWDLESSRLLPGPAGHTGAVQAVAALGDGVVLTFGPDGTLRRWRADTGKELERSAIPGEPPAFSPSTTDIFAVALDGKTVVVQKNLGNVSVRDVATGRELRSWEGSPTLWFFSMKLSRNGRLLAALDYKHIIHIRDVGSGKELPPLADELPEDSFPRRLREVSDYEFTPDGRSLITLTTPGDRAPAGSPHSTLRLWDVANGRLIRQWSSEDGAGLMTFSPDGRNLAVVTTQHVVLWETASGKERWRFKSTGGVPAFSADGRLLTVGQRDAVHVWDVRAGKELDRLVGHEGAILALSFTPDGRALLSGSADSTTLVWDASRLSGRIVPPSAKLTAKEVESYWNDLADLDAGKAFRAVVGLGAASEHSVPWLRDHLRSTTDLKDVERWIVDLESESFDTRQKAEKALEKAGESAVPALKKVLKGNPSTEVTRSVRELLSRLESTQVLPPDALRQVRAVEVLEHAGTPEAKKLLEELSKGAPESRLTREAKVALENLTPRSDRQEDERK